MAKTFPCSAAPTFGDALQRAVHLLDLAPAEKIGVIWPKTEGFEFVIPF